MIDSNDLYSIGQHLVHWVVNLHVYLAHPPSSSWVPLVASMFRAVALAMAIPTLLITFFDIASYVVVRTLGMPHAHPASTKRQQMIAQVPPSPTTPRVPLLSRSSESLSFSSKSSTPSHILLPRGYFATEDTGANYSLAGVGLFSPPQSRTPSPPLTRRSRRVDEGVHLSLNSSAEEISKHASLRRRLVPTEES